MAQFQTSVAPPPYLGNAGPMGAAPPPPPYFDQGARFQEFCARYEIGAEYASKLRLLSDVEIVVVADDSGSMSTMTQIDDDPFGPMQSRWDELKKSLLLIVDIALLFDQNGIDIYFLNRTAMDQHGRLIRLVLRNVTQPAAIEAAFAAPPGGFTPLARTVKSVFDEKQAIVKEKRLLCLICTDGEPTNDSGVVDIDGFRTVLATRQPIDRIFVNIMACSDDDGAIGYLSKLDSSIKNLDVIDDYRSERKEVLRKAPGAPYSFGDHIVKTLVGSLDPSMDKLDEKSSCCVLL